LRLAQCCQTWSVAQEQLLSHQSYPLMQAWISHLCNNHRAHTQAPLVSMDWFNVPKHLYEGAQNSNVRVRCLGCETLICMPVI
jgi:hypothetical protein